MRFRCAVRVYLRRHLWPHRLHTNIPPKESYLQWLHIQRRPIRTHGWLGVMIICVVANDDLDIVVDTSHLLIYYAWPCLGAWARQNTFKVLLYSTYMLEEFLKGWCVDIVVDTTHLLIYCAWPCLGSDKTLLRFDLQQIVERVFERFFFLGTKLSDMSHLRGRYVVCPPPARNHRHKKTACSQFSLKNGRSE